MSDQQINYYDAKAWLERTIAYESQQFGKLQQLPVAYFHVLALLKGIDALTAERNRYRTALEAIRNAWCFTETSRALQAIADKALRGEGNE